MNRKKTMLYAPPEFWKLTPKEVKEVSNGCGGKGIGALVPDYIWGVCVTPA